VPSLNRVDSCLDFGVHFSWETADYHRRRLAATAGSGSGSDFAIGGLALSRYPSAIAGLLLSFSVAVLFQVVLGYALSPVLCTVSRRFTIPGDCRRLLPGTIATVRQVATRRS